MSTPWSNTETAACGIVPVETGLTRSLLVHWDVIAEKLVFLLPLPKKTRAPSKTAYFEALFSGTVGGQHTEQMMIVVTMMKDAFWVQWDVWLVPA